MAATSTPEVVTTPSTFHVMVIQGYFHGIFEIKIEETVRVLKERVAAYINTIRDDPSLRIPYKATEENPEPDFPCHITADDFELRRVAIADVPLEDSKVLGEYVEYKYITPELVMLMINKHGVVSPIDIPASAESRDAPAIERSVLKEKCAQKTQAEYEAFLKKQ